MKPGTTTTLLGLCIAVSLSGGCGGESAEKERADARADARAAKRAKAQAKYEKCSRQLGPLVEDLQALTSRLDVGLNYEEYTDEVANLKVTYDRVIDRLDNIECVEAAVPAESALNQHLQATSTWGDCFEDIYCENDSIQPSLQRRWAKASRLIDRADARLEDLRPG